MAYQNPRAETNSKKTSWAWLRHAMWLIVLPVGFLWCVQAWHTYGEGTSVGSSAHRLYHRAAQLSGRRAIGRVLGEYRNLASAHSSSDNLAATSHDVCMAPLRFLSGDLQDKPLRFGPSLDLVTGKNRDCISQVLMSTATLSKQPVVAFTSVTSKSSAASVLPGNTVSSSSNIVLAQKTAQPASQYTGPLAVPALRDKTSCSRGLTLNVVAHQDDDLLFLNPDVQSDISDGHCVRTVYLTAGDAGQRADYWSGREQGAKAAYAAMYGAENVWHDERQLLAGRQLSVSYLDNTPQVALVFLRLPDGNLRGEGFAGTTSESLQKLLSGEIASIRSIDTQAVYTKDGLVEQLYAFMSLDLPDQIRTQNPLGVPDGDHADHAAAGALSELASNKYLLPHAVANYAGYPDKLLDPNLTNDQVDAKQNVFLAYARYDGAVCQSHNECAQTLTYGSYLARLYKTAETTSAP
jgi:LmbE family N-acetylglucosaminyl deacetylase